MKVLNVMCKPKVIIPACLEVEVKIKTSLLQLTLFKHLHYLYKRHMRI